MSILSSELVVKLAYEDSIMPLLSMSIGIFWVVGLCCHLSLGFLHGMYIPFVLDWDSVNGNRESQASEDLSGRIVL